MRRAFVAGVAFGSISFILVQESVPDKNRPYYLAADHIHTELPEGTDNNNNSRAGDWEIPAQPRRPLLQVCWDFFLIVSPARARNETAGRLKSGAS